MPTGSRICKEYTWSTGLTPIFRIRASIGPGNDVLDWPIKRRPLPILDVNQNDADERFYEELSLRQTQMLAAPPTHATPTVLLAADDAGNGVRVAIRQRI